MEKTKELNDFILSNGESVIRICYDTEYTGGFTIVPMTRAGLEKLLVASKPD